MTDENTKPGAIAEVFLRISADGMTLLGISRSDLQTRAVLLSMLCSGAAIAAGIVSKIPEGIDPRKSAGDLGRKFLEESVNALVRAGVDGTPDLSTINPDELFEA